MAQGMVMSIRLSKTSVQAMNCLTHGYSLCDVPHLLLRKSPEAHHLWVPNWQSLIQPTFVQIWMKEKSRPLAFLAGCLPVSQYMQLRKFDWAQLAQDQTIKMHLNTLIRLGIASLTNIHWQQTLIIKESWLTHFVVGPTRTVCKKPEELQLHPSRYLHSFKKVQPCLSKSSVTLSTRSLILPDPTLWL